MAKTQAAAAPVKQGVVVSEAVIPAAVANLAGRTIRFSAVYERFSRWLSENVPGLPEHNVKVLASFPTTRPTRVTDLKWWELLPPVQILPKNVDPDSIVASEGYSPDVHAVEKDGETMRTRTVDSEGAYTLLVSPMMPEAFDVAVAGILARLIAHNGGLQKDFQAMAGSLGFEPGQKLDADGNPKRNTKGDEIPPNWRYARPNAVLTDKLAGIIDSENITIPPALDYRTFSRIVQRQARGVLACPSETGDCGTAADGKAYRLSFAVTPAQAHLIAGATCSKHNVPLAFTEPDSGEAAETVTDASANAA